MNARLLHYRIAILFSVFIAASAVTGLLWAYAPYLYWQGGYKEKKRPAVAVDLNAVAVDLPRVASALSANGGTPRVESVVLKSEAGRVYYLVKGASPGGRVLIDAASGNAMSPITEALAINFARQYVAGEPAVSSATLVTPWEDRKHARFESAWVVSFADDRETEIVIDARSGEVLEDSDSVRRFHFGVMTLHQFSFFGTHKELTALSGVPLVLLLVTGLVLGRKRFRLSARK